MRQIRHLSTFESLGLRDYRLLWLGHLTTSMGQWMDQTARSWLIYTLTGSALQLGLVSAARGLPLLFFGVVAGVVADRYGRKMQLIIAQVVNVFLNVILATLVMTGHIQPWHIYVTAFLNGTVQSFQQPARQVLISDLAGDKYLLNAVALASTALNLSRSLGPALCGILIQTLGVDASYYFQAGLFVLATVWTVQMRVPKLSSLEGYSPGKKETPFFDSMKEGFAYIGSHRLVLSLTVLGLAPMLLGMPYTSLMPIFALDVLHGNVGTQGFLLTMVGIGAVLGGLIIASLGRMQGNGKLVTMGAAGFGLSLVFFSRSPVIWMSAIFAFMAGLSNSGYTSQSQTLIQTLTPPVMRGRVIGVYLLNKGMMPLGSLLAGVLAEFLGGPWAVTIMGSSCFLLAICVAIAEPGLWRSGLLDREKAATRA